MQTKTKIALLMANDGSAYHVANFLSKKMDCLIDVFHYTNHTISKSKNINNFYIVYSPFENIQKTIEEITEINAKNHYDLIIPINDVALEIANILGRNLSNVLIHNNENADKYRSKISIWELAKRLNLPHLQSIIISNLDEYEKLRDELAIPTILKPNKSAQIVKNRVHKYGVRLAEKIQHVDNFVYDHINVMPIMIQEVKEGFGVGFNFFAIEGEIQSHYSHQRLTENNGGGVSSLRKTIPPEKFNLFEISKEIIKEMNWTGIGMLEYRVYNDVPYIMELNGRPWGSLMLGEKSGANPVFHYVDWGLNKTLPKYSGYKINLVGRKLKEDIKNVAKSIKSENLFSLFSWVASFKSEILNHGFIEDHFIHDPKFAKVYWIPKSKPRISVPIAKEINHINPDQKICFVCFGNINRSPFAEKVLKEIYPNIDCVSAGIHNLSDRKASRQAIKNGLQFGCDLGNHRSKYINEIDLSKYILIVMDQSNVVALNKLGIEENIFLLDSKDIEDPHGKSDQFFTQVYSSIYNRIQNLVALSIN